VAQAGHDLTHDLVAPELTLHDAHGEVDELGDEPDGRALRGEEANAASCARPRLSACTPFGGGDRALRTLGAACVTRAILRGHACAARDADQSSPYPFARIMARTRVRIAGSASAAFAWRSASRSRCRRFLSAAHGRQSPPGE